MPEADAAREVGIEDVAECRTSLLFLLAAIIANSDLLRSMSSLPRCDALVADLALAA
jgi:hypothetical protein